MRAEDGRRISRDSQPERLGPLQAPFFNPEKTYEENYAEGPFGIFADGKVYEEKGEPQYEVFGHKIYTPFGIPAGPLLNGRFVDASLDHGFDIPVHKTVRTRLKKSHPFPNVLAVNIDGDLTLEKAKQKLVANNNYNRVNLSITNSFANPSFDPEVWQRDMEASVKHAKKGQMVWASLEGTKWDGYDRKQWINDWVEGAKRVYETGVRVLEFNESCPNEGTSNLLCNDPETSGEITYAVKEAVTGLYVVKKTAFQRGEQLKRYVWANRYADGFAGINTISAEVIDEFGNQALPGEGRAISGVCGDGIRWAGLEMTKQLKELRDEFGLNYVIVGVGGVSNPEHYKQYRDAGADVVMSATGAMWNPNLAIEIKQAA